MQYASMDRIGNDKNLFSQFFCPNTIKEDVLEELEKRMKDMQRTQLCLSGTMEIHPFITAQHMANHQ